MAEMNPIGVIGRSSSQCFRNMLGLLNAIGIKNVGTLNSSLKTWIDCCWGTEAITETTQSFVEQIGSTAGTLAGLDIDPKQAIAEGILGGTAAGVVQTPATDLGKKPRSCSRNSGFLSIGFGCRS